ncbi:MAG: nucleotidyltransferase family protein [Clostridia bacterium]|nr:nucleotidyltransferase family protein [Clostridia bacterium]
MFNYIGLEENFIYDLVNSEDVFSNSTFGNVNYKKVFELTMEQRIFPTVYCLLRENVDSEAFVVFEKEKQRIRLKNAIVKHQIKAIVTCFYEHNIKFAISKGIAHANEIYRDPFLRDMNDIDIVISSDDYIKGCEMLESIGYAITETANDKIAFFEANRSQCTFVKGGCLSVELKDRIQYVWQNHLEQWFDRVEYKDIGGVSVPVFSTEDMFINILVNSNKNMSTPYGIDNDYRIRDLLELYLFIFKNHSIFTKEFVNMLTQDGYAHSLSCMMDYCEEFFTRDKYEKIPQALRQARTTDYGKDHVRWKTPIVRRLFDTEQRIQEHHLFRFGNYFGDDSRATFISNGDTIDVGLTDYAKDNNINISFKLQVIDDKVRLSFSLNNLPKESVYYIRVRIADPSTIDEKAYRTNIINLSGSTFTYMSENDEITYSKEKSELTVACHKDKILFGDKASFFMSFLMNEIHSENKSSQCIGFIGESIRLKKIILNN